METILFNKINEKYYYEVLDNGLEVYMYPNNKANNFYMTFNTRFGSIHTDFKRDKDKKYHHVPNGCAHFLEHLMFYEKDGSTAHEKFAMLGSSTNAATSFNSTYYEVMGTSKFTENLNYLLDFVQDPYFTKQNVSNEKGIIIEEIMMGKSNPYRELFFGSRDITFANSNYKYSISGEKKDVEQITLDDINLCYEYFYHPKNMFVIITGNFNPIEALTIIKNNQSKKKFEDFSKPIIKTIKEIDKVVNKLIKIDLNVEIPKACFSTKINRNCFKIKDDFELLTYLNLYFDMGFGSTSAINEMLLENNLIIEEIMPSVTICDNIVLIVFAFDSLYPEQTVDIIKQELIKLKVNNEDLIRKKRVQISRLILSFDNIFDVHDSMQEELFKFMNIYNNEYDLYNKLTISKMNEVVKCLDYNNSSLFIVEPLKKNPK